MTESGWVMFMRDRPQLAYHFGKLGKEGWKDLARASGFDSPPDPTMRRAQRRFYAAYGLPEFANPVTSLAATEFLEESRAGRLPAWVVALADVGDIRDAAKEVSHVR